MLTITSLLPARRGRMGSLYVPGPKYDRLYDEIEKPREQDTTAFPLSIARCAARAGMGKGSTSLQQHDSRREVRRPREPRLAHRQPQARERMCWSSNAGGAVSCDAAHPAKDLQKSSFLARKRHPRPIEFISLPALRLAVKEDDGEQSEVFGRASVEEIALESVGRRRHRPLRPW